MRARFILVLGILMGFSISTFAQTKLKLSSVKPGTEQVQLIPNGDFQFQGPPAGTTYPSPTGWSRSGDMYATTGTNTALYDNGVVAQAQLTSGSLVSSYARSVTLEPSTAYVFSGYLWNMGDSANHVNTVIDFNDVSGEPQIVLGASDLEADKGYFVYRSFNTSTTGTNILVRAFYDGLTGTGAAASCFPIAAQWDNLAITKATDFVPPQSSNSAATLRPLVSITNPVDGALLYVSNPTVGMIVAAAANDLDGTITNVQFFAGTNKIGQSTASPWVATWANMTSGSYILTALATDNDGATTLSAPVSISVNVSPLPSTLRIALAGTNVSLYWPTGNESVVVQQTSNLFGQVSWQIVTNAAVVTNSLKTVALPIHPTNEFFRLAPEVDPGTMYHKLLMGYQGWFACAGDGSPVNQWVHWFRNNNPVATNATVDFWPVGSPGTELEFAL